MSAGYHWPENFAIPMVPHRSLSSSGISLLTWSRNSSNTSCASSRVSQFRYGRYFSAIALSPIDFLEFVRFFAIVEIDAVSLKEIRIRHKTFCSENRRVVICCCKLHTLAKNLSACFAHLNVKRNTTAYRRLAQSNAIPTRTLSFVWSLTASIDSPFPPAGSIAMQITGCFCSRMSHELPPGRFVPQNPTYIVMLRIVPYEVMHI